MFRILVATFLLGVLALTLFYIFFVPHIGYNLTAARRAATIAELYNLHEAIQAFHRDTHRLPTTAESLDALVTKPTNADGWQGPYFYEVPFDKWGRPYIYIFPNPQDPTTFNLHSMGNDGIDGTADDITKYSK